jgi:hypothetical protein
LCGGLTGEGGLESRAFVFLAVVCYGHDGDER